MVSELSLSQMFQLQVEQTPDAVAVVDRHQSITYRELDYLSDRLAGYLQMYGVTLDETIGILMETCSEYVISYIAILKAGGAYIPLDLAYPNSFLGRILSEAKPKVIVTKSQYAGKVDPNLAVQVLSIDTDGAWRNCSFDEIGLSLRSLDNLAFVAYTSGTFFYHNPRIPYAHAIWHVFVLAGSISHGIAVGVQMVGA